MTDIEIAKQVNLENILDIAKKTNIDENDVELYGKYKAKISNFEKYNKNSKGKLVLVTAMSPTPLGEGKTTISIAIADGLRKIGKKSILPNEVQNSKKVLKWIKENIDSNVYVSIMAQYFPTYKAKEMPEIARKITKEEYEKVENYLYELDLENGYIQELGEHEEEYVPTWEY